ncbi:hypothetical protein THAOC_29954 [Thalassiosira oceanica]|uniref:Uncharacterized protein n=1 Tax=Thalassiosira oceanica TaxID=159749 RepID=K0RW20_THAOC|nr:hypothetical protein THAOC_29954 [Thalassiosira oceanica]|eukprot:EJK50932.1 hypothetical protein THAOC_29954 [Thalassiosira oceanica]
MDRTGDALVGGMVSVASAAGSVSGAALERLSRQGLKLAKSRKGGRGRGRRGEGILRCGRRRVEAVPPPTPHGRREPPRDVQRGGRRDAFGEDREEEGAADDALPGFVPSLLRHDPARGLRRIGEEEGQAYRVLRALPGRRGAAGTGAAAAAGATRPSSTFWTTTRPGPTTARASAAGAACSCARRPLPPHARLPPPSHRARVTVHRERRLPRPGPAPRRDEPGPRHGRADPPHVPGAPRRGPPGGLRRRGTAPGGHAELRPAHRHEGRAGRP